MMNREIKGGVTEWDKSVAAAKASVKVPQMRESRRGNVALRMNNHSSENLDPAPNTIINGVIAQPVLEQSPYKRQVTGSNPVHAKQINGGVRFQGCTVSSRNDLLHEADRRKSVTPHGGPAPNTSIPAIMPNYHHRAGSPNPALSPAHPTGSSPSKVNHTANGASGLSSQTTEVSR